MTTKQLEELKKKFANNTGTIQDVGLILTEFFQSFSSHVKDIKTEIKEVKSNQEILFNELENIKEDSNPIYKIIMNDED